jgi:hypothetical protein
VKILGISGSLRKGSYNTALLRAAVALMPEGVQLEIGSIAGIPLYDGDLEASQGIPPAVQTLKASVTQADGLLLVTPEYNNSIPGVFKPARIRSYKAAPDALYADGAVVELRDGLHAGDDALRQRGARPERAHRAAR